MYQVDGGQMFVRGYTHTERQASAAVLSNVGQWWCLGTGLGLIFKHYHWPALDDTVANAWRSVWVRLNAKKDVEVSCYCGDCYKRRVTKSTFRKPRRMLTFQSPKMKPSRISSSRTILLKAVEDRNNNVGPSKSLAIHSMMDEDADFH